MKTFFTCIDKKELKLLFSLPVIVAALGYFVDICDLLLFSIVRRQSLITRGVPEVQLWESFYYRAQLSGLLIGGIIRVSWATSAEGFPFCSGLFFCTPWPT